MIPREPGKKNPQGPQENTLKGTHRYTQQNLLEAEQTALNRSKTRLDSGEHQLVCNTRGKRSSNAGNRNKTTQNKIFYLEPFLSPST